MLSCGPIWSLHSSVSSSWIATRTPSAIVDVARAPAVLVESLTVPVMFTVPSYGATQRRTGVSALTPYTGTPSDPRRPNRTLEPSTRSIMLSPLTSAKYWFVLANEFT